MAIPQYIEANLTKLNYYISYPTTKDRIEGVFEKANLDTDVEEWITYNLPEGTYNNYGDLRQALGLHR